MKTSDYFFFLIWLILKKPTLNPKKNTPKSPIIYGIPLSYILIVVGQISLIRYPKIQDIAETIISIIPIIKNIKNPFFVLIFYSRSNIINIFINKFFFSILYKMKKILFFLFFYLEN